MHSQLFRSLAKLHFRILFTLVVFCATTAQLHAQAMVVAAHELASEAGLAVLNEGGSAADAALATAFVLNVVEPHASGLGGGGFALYYPANGQTEVIDYRETAPALVDPQRFLDPADSLHSARYAGGSSIGVPGTAAGLEMLWLRHGRLPLKRLLAPAISYCRKGYPVSETLAGQIQEKLDTIMGNEGLSALYLKDGFPPAPGEILLNLPLADVLQSLVEHGLGSFYATQAQAISATVQADMGWINEADLHNYKAIRRTAIRGSYRGLSLVGAPPPATGAIAVMECLNIVEAMDLKSLSESERLHLLAEAHKKAWRDRGTRLGDPDYCQMPLDSLLDKTYARAQLEQIYPDALHHNWPPLGSQSWHDKIEQLPPLDHGNTTHISIRDAQGGMLSLTQSLNYFFGSGLMVNGYMLNNTMADFTFDEQSLNWPVAGKRPRSSMAPMIAVKDGRPVLCLGTPGGPRIVSAMEQILVYHLDLGLGIQAAIDAPRFHPLGSTFVYEERFETQTLQDLEKIGYRPYPNGEFNRYFGGAHGISLLRGTLEGGADPRRDGKVAGGN